MSHAPISKNHLFRLNSSISRLLMFAKPGVMSKKLLEGSVYDDRGIMNEVRKAVTSQEVPESATREGGGLYMPTKGGGKRPVNAGDLRSVNAAGDARRALYDYAKENGVKLDDRDKEAPVREWTKAERQKLAQATGTRRKMLQAIRKRETELNGEPARTGYDLTDREKGMLGDSSKRYEKIIKSAEARDAAALKERGSRYLEKLTERAKQGILRQQGGVVTANLEPDFLTKKALDVVNIVDSPMPPTPEEVARATSVLGVNERKLALMRKAAGKLTAPGSDREAIMRRSAKRLDTPVFGGAVNSEALNQATTYPARPKGWKGPIVDVSRKSFPTLKKLGIVAGIIGGGVAASKMLSGRKKKEEQKMLMSARGRLVQFARMDRYKAMVKASNEALEQVKLRGNSRDLARAEMARLPYVGDIPRVGRGKDSIDLQRTVVASAAEQLRNFYRSTPFALKLNRERAVQDATRAAEAAIRNRDAQIKAREAARAIRPTGYVSAKERKAAQKKAAGRIKNETRETREDGTLINKEPRSPIESNIRKVIDALNQHKVKGVSEEIQDRMVMTHQINRSLEKRNKDLQSALNQTRETYRKKLEDTENLRTSLADSQRGMADMQRTYNDRVKKEISGVKQSLGEQHKKAMFDEESRRYKHVAIGTGAGLVGGAALGSSAMREADENKSKQKQLRFERGEYDDAKRMAISSAVTGAAGGGIVASLLRPRDGNAFRKGGPAPKAAPLRKQFNRIGKAAFKAGAFMGAAGLASSLVGRAILGKPDKRDAASATKSGAVGGAVVGGLSGAALGALAGADQKKLAVFGLTKKAAGLVRRNKNWLPIAAMGKGGSARRALIGGAVGTLAGAAQMADEGQQADTLRNLKKPVKMSSKVRQIRFAEAPLSGKLAADRYRKRIQDEDLDRRDANIMRTMLAGAALGGVMKGRRGAAAGAGAGALLVPLIRTRTEAGKDMYGERTREGKRAEGIPWKAAALGAGALAAHKGINRVRGVANRFNVGAKNAKKAAKIAGLVGAGLIGANLLMNSKLKTIQFRDEEDIETDREFLGNPEGSREWRKGRIIANKAIVYGKRGTRLAKDIVRAVKGEKNVDSRGRERQREWDKPWVRKMVLTGILATGALGARRIVKGTAEGTKLAEARNLWQSGAFHKAAAVKFPRIAAAKRWLVGTTDDAVSEAASGINQSGIMGRINKWGREGAEKYDAAKKAAARGAAGEAAGPIDDATEAAKQLAGAKEYARIRAEELKKGKIIEGKFSKPSNQRGVIRFISNEDRAPGWDTRREGDLVLLKDIRRRERREKKLLERKDWQDTVVTPAKMTASWLGGMGLMAILHKGGRAAGSRTSGGAGAAVTNDRSIYADKLWEGIAKGAKRRAMGMSSVTKDLIALSSLLDDVL